jgi:hypothetical protein
LHWSQAAEIQPLHTEDDDNEVPAVVSKRVDADPEPGTFDCLMGGQLQRMKPTHAGFIQQSVPRCCCSAIAKTPFPTDQSE